MVHFEAAKKLAPTLIASGKQWLINSLHNVATTSHHHQNEASLSEEPNQQLASTEYLVYHWFESLFAWFQVIILWHEPLMSLIAISGLLTSFLLLTYFAPRFYATIMIAIFIYNLSKFWFRYLWPSIRVPPGADREAEMRLDVDRFTYLHPQLLTLAELGQHLEIFMHSSEYYLSKIFELRQQRPVAFCSSICLFLSCTAYIGNRISGVNLIFWSITFIMTAPGIYYQLLPQSARDWLKSRSIIIKQKIYDFYSQHHQHQHQQQQQQYDDSQLKGSQDLLDETSAGKDDGVESLASTIASTTKAQALSIFEQFKRKSFSFGSEKATTTALATSHGNKNNQQQQQQGTVRTATVPSSTIDVPRNNDQTRRQSRDELRQRKHISLDDNDQDFNSDLRSNSNGQKEDFSSNSSTSLIDSDDEQQDGFVLL